LHAREKDEHEQIETSTNKEGDRKGCIFVQRRR